MASEAWVLQAEWVQLVPSLGSCLSQSRSLSMVVVGNLTLTQARAPGKMALSSQCRKTSWVQSPKPQRLKSLKVLKIPAGKSEIPIGRTAAPPQYPLVLSLGHSTALTSPVPCKRQIWAWWWLQKALVGHTTRTHARPTPGPAGLSQWLWKKLHPATARSPGLRGREEGWRLWTFIITLFVLSAQGDTLNSRSCGTTQPRSYPDCTPWSCSLCMMRLRGPAGNL